MPSSAGKALCNVKSHMHGSAKRFLRRLLTISLCAFSFCLAVLGCAAESALPNRQLGASQSTRFLYSDWAFSCFCCVGLRGGISIAVQAAGCPSVNSVVIGCAAKVINVLR